MPTETLKESHTAAAATITSDSFSITAGDKLFISVCAHLEGTATTLDITATSNTLGVTFAQEVELATSASGSDSQVHAWFSASVSADDSGTATFGCTGAGKMSLVAVTVTSAGATANTDSASHGYGTANLTLTLNPAPATGSLVLVGASKSLATYAEPATITPGSGWTGVVDELKILGTNRYLYHEVQSRTGSTSTTAGMTSSSGEQDYFMGVAIEISAGGVAFMHRGQFDISQAVQRAAVR